MDAAASVLFLDGLELWLLLAVCVFHNIKGRVLQTLECNVEVEQLRVAVSGHIANSLGR